jgi:exodeoxyribonuclease-3
MTFSITTWNINSVRLRMPIVQQFIVRHQPDILCLQEIKCQEHEFPLQPLKDLGYGNIIIHGQKGYHGVAIASKVPLAEDHRQNYCGMGDARHISALFERGSRRIRLHNFYVPAGGDEPDRTVNPKFGHKLDFVEEMKALKADAMPASRRCSSATSTLRRSNTTSGRTSRCSRLSAIRRWKPTA